MSCIGVAEDTTASGGQEMFVVALNAINKDGFSHFVSLRSQNVLVGFYWISFGI